MEDAALLSRACTDPRRHSRTNVRFFRFPLNLGCSQGAQLIECGGN